MNRIRLAFLALALTSATFAQDAKPKADPLPKKGVLPTHYKQLGLSKDQLAEVYKITAAYTKTAAELKAKLEEAKSIEKAALLKVLTADQVKKLRELQTGEPTPPKDKDKPTDKDK